MRSLSLTALCAFTLTSASCALFQKPEAAQVDPHTGQTNPYGPYGSAPQPSYGSAAQPNPYTTAQGDPYAAPNPYPGTNPYSSQQQGNPYGSYETPQTYPAQSGGTYQQPYVQTDSTPSYSGGGRSHTVVKGDTLSGLARKYNTSVSAIKQANGMTNDTIVLGKTLTIP